MLRNLIKDIVESKTNSLCVIFQAVLQPASKRFFHKDIMESKTKSRCVIFQVVLQPASERFFCH